MNSSRQKLNIQIIRILKQMWSEEETVFRGDFYRINGAPLKPKPVSPPPVFQGGNRKVQTITLYGNDDQKERWLKPVRKGLIGTYSTSERASGGHWWFNFSEASRDSDAYVLNAEKSFTTSAGQADFYLVQTRSPGAQSPTDVSFFIVAAACRGLRPVYGTRWAFAAIIADRSDTRGFASIREISSGLTARAGKYWRAACLPCI